MSLIILEAVLARIYTDRAYREAFLADPGGACSDLDLTESERGLLIGLDHSGLERYARSLIGKRLDAVKLLIPGVAAQLTQRLRMWFERYCESSPGLPEPDRDALAFLQFLTEQNFREPVYMDELLRCENIRLELLSAHEAGPQPTALTARSRIRLTPRACLAEFGYDMPAIYRALIYGEVPPAEPDPCTILFTVRASSGPVDMRRLEPAAAHLLRALDGITPWGDVMRGLADRLGIGLESRAAFENECRSFAQGLLESGLAEPS